MKNWKAIDLLDISGGMSTNVKYPGNKYAKRLLNVSHSEKPGALVLRSGYSSKYALPTNPTITNSSYLNFDLFYDNEADPAGKEITCVIQKGIVTALTDGSSPIVNDTIKGFWFWTTPDWNGTQWTSGWNWVNRTIITKILTAKNGGYGCSFGIYGRAIHGIADDTLIGWTIFNKTKGDTAKIITCKRLSTTEVTINITKDINDWDANDVVIISRCWLDLDIQEEYYNNVKRSDIVFHRINNDLRIGFGGYEKRPALLIGYRKVYLLLEKIDYTLNIPGGQSVAVERFCKTDGVILSKMTLDRDSMISIETTTVGDTPTGKYSFKVIGVMDGYIRQLTDEGGTTLINKGDIRIKIATGMADGNIDNYRLTDYELFGTKKDEDVYYCISKHKIRDKEYTGRSLILGKDGQIILRSSLYGAISGDPELHHDANCTNPYNERNSIGGWQILNGLEGDLSSLSSTLIRYRNIFAYNGSKFLEWYWRINQAYHSEITSPFLIDEWRRCKIKFSVLVNRTEFVTPTPENKISLCITSTGIHPNLLRETYVLRLDHSMTHWMNVEFEMEISGKLHFYLDSFLPGEDYKVLIDNLTVTIESEGISDEELTDKMGYTPTYNVVRGWDKALIKDGRTYFFNPFVEKRYENFILVSHIAPPNTFLWDIATFENYREIERNDNNRLVTADLISNKEIVILKDSSVTSLIDDGRVGILRETIYGVDCVSKDSLVNINGTLFWCGKDDIFAFNLSTASAPQPLLKDTIKNLYLAIENKSEIFGVRNRHGGYRIRVNNPAQKIEYLLTRDGWVEERRFHFPEIYRYGFNNTLYFLSGSNIYEEEKKIDTPDPTEYGGF